jgi:hypothetical protein
MPGFLKAATLVMSGGAIVGAGAFEAIPEHALAPLFATAAIPNLAPVPCKQQLWLNADRACQTWTVPHRDVRRALLLEPPTPEPELHVATASTQTPHTSENEAKSTHNARGSTESHASAPPPRRAETRRVITSRAAMESSL